MLNAPRFPARSDTPRTNPNPFPPHEREYQTTWPLFISAGHLQGRSSERPFFISHGAEDQSPRVTRDHQVLVSRDDAHRASTGRHTDRIGVRLVALRIEIDPQILKAAAHLEPDRRGPLSDAGGEDQKIESAEHGRQRSDLLAHLV